MTDIVEQLRQGALTHDDYRWEAAAEIERLREVFKNVQHSRVLQGKAISDAAAEIERLRVGNQQAALDYLGQIGQLSDEIERLRAEVETWVGKAKTAIWSDSEECKLLTADNERLRAALRDAYEVYAGSDGFIPETAAEGYQQQIIRQMVDCISAALEDTEAKRMERSDND